MRFSLLESFVFVFAAFPTLVHSFDFTNIPDSQAAQHAFTKAADGMQQQQQASSNSTSQQQSQSHHPSEPDSVLYNVSSLGMPDPFAHYSTHLTYDSKVEIGDPHNNQKGSILTLLNGTIYPLGSVGGIGAIGWEGDSNDTDVNLEETTRTKAGSVKKNASGGMSGIWLAFTSQDAITGGYTLNNKTLTTSNNLIYHNLTFLSNFTMHDDGSFTFKFSLATVPGGKAHLDSPRCTEKAEKKGDAKFSMICTGSRKE